jgi:hypothetical protein
MTALRSVVNGATRPPAGRGRRCAGAVVFAAAAVALFTAYLRLSQTYPENSDEANILLMAGDLARGNLLLSGWDVSDVPFISTELPEIALLVKVFGLHLNTAHIAAALTYTVVVGMALLLARGRAGGPAAVAAMAVALAVMLAPQPGIGVFVLIFSVGHIGTAAPVMLTWLVIDRAARPAASGAGGAGGPGGPDGAGGWDGPGGAGGQPGTSPGGTPAGAAPRRWPVPVTVAALLAWALMADPLVLVIAVFPLLAVAAVRLAGGLSGPLRAHESVLGRLRAALRHGRLEASLVPAAAAACLAAACGGRLVRAAGGYAQPSVPFALDPVGTWYAHSLVVLHGLLAMFGAFCVPGNAVNYLGPGDYAAAPPLSGLPEAVAVTRLACVALAVAAAGMTARRFLRPDADLVSQLLLAGLVANLAAYLPSSLAGHTALNAREFAPVLPFAAVIAGRTAGGWLGDRVAGALRRGAGRRGDRVLTAGLCALLCWYGLGLWQETTIPAAPDPFARLEAFLARHHLTRGIGGYWNASVITVDTGGAVTIRAVTQGCLQPYDWESEPAWYDPAGATATFVLDSTGTGYFSRWQASPAALRQLGALVPAASPATLHPGGGYTVRAYRGSVLGQLPRLTRCQRPVRQPVR